MPTLDDADARAVCRRGTLHGGDGERATCCAGRWTTTARSTCEHGVDDDDLVQLLYTSGTTSRAQGRDDDPPRARPRVRVVRSSRSDLSARRRPAARAAALSLGADARLPDALAGGRRDQPPPRGTGHRRHLRAGARDGDRRAVPAADGVGRRRQPPAARRRATSAACARRSTARRSCPCRCCSGCSAGCPAVGFYNCFGQSEIGPLATVLRPEEHAGAAGLGAVARCCSSRPGSSTRTMRDVAPGEAGRGRVPLAAAVHRLLGQAARRPRRPSAAAGSTPATSCRIDDEGYLFVVDRIKDVINTGGVLVASREVEDVLYTHPAVAEVAVIGLPARALDRGDHRARGRAARATSTPAS